MSKDLQSVILIVAEDICCQSVNKAALIICFLLYQYCSDVMVCVLVVSAVASSILNTEW